MLSIKYSKHKTTKQLVCRLDFCILAIFITLLPRLEATQENVELVLEELLARVSHPECDHLTVVSKNASKIMEIRQAGHHPKLIISGEHIVQNSKEIKKFVTKWITCLISLTWVEDSTIKALSKATTSLEFHTLLLIGERTPKDTSLRAASGPAFWINIDTSAAYAIYKYCPKEQSEMSQFEPATIWNSHSGIVKPIATGCPGYLFGQPITFGYSYKTRTVKYDGKEIKSGDHANLFLYLSNKLKFQPHFHKLNLTDYEDFYKYIEDVSQRKITISIGRFINVFKHYMEVLNPHFYDSIHYVTRTPRPIATYNSLVLPFSKMVWSLILASLFGFFLMFYLTHSVYSSEDLADKGLHKYENSCVNFAIITFFKMTEPEAVPWFTKKWSTGRLLILLWSMHGFLVVSFYNCNLRAHLSSITYEEKIDTVYDVIDNGQNVWMKFEMAGNMQNHPEESGSGNLPVYKVASMVPKNGGFYSESTHGGIPVKAIEDMVTNKAVTLLSRNFLNYELRLNPKYNTALNGDKLYMSRETAMSLNACAVIRKDSPAREEINTAVMTAVETGLIYKWVTEGRPAEAFIQYQLPLVADGTKISIQHMAPAAGFCLLCLIVAMAAFATEIY